MKAIDLKKFLLNVPDDTEIVVHRWNNRQGSQYYPLALGCTQKKPGYLIVTKNEYCNLTVEVNNTDLVDDDLYQKPVNDAEKLNRQLADEVILSEWKDQAKNNGDIEDYEYHLSVKKNPLPYGIWKNKNEELKKIQAREDYKKGDPLPGNMERRSIDLCNQLGY